MNIRDWLNDYKRYSRQSRTFRVSDVILIGPRTLE
jgi:hypothetical protein